MNYSSQFSLLKKRSFLPMFITQFLAAFNDNLFKNALVILITYRLADEYGVNGQVLVTAVAGVFVLPMIIFSAFAGQLADKYDKTVLIKVIKIAEIAIMIFASIAFCYNKMWWLIILLFCMGTHSAFFGPIKYSILPQHLNENELVAGNGLVSAGTFIAILLGTISGGLLVLRESGHVFISAAILSTALLGWIACLFIPSAPSSQPDLELNWNIFSATWQIVGNTRKNRAVFRAILGICWFWFVGAVFLAQCPNFAKNIIGANEQVSTLFIVIFSVGVGLGSMLCNRLLKGEVSTRFVPLACLGMSLSIFVLAFVCRFVPHYPSLVGVGDFVKAPAACAVMGMLLLMTMCGGLYNVPMYALMQDRTPKEEMARAVACLNVSDSFGMVLSAVFSMVLLACRATVVHIFICLGIANLGVALFVRKIEKAEK